MDSKRIDEEFNPGRHPEDPDEMSAAVANPFRQTIQTQIGFEFASMFSRTRLRIRRGRADARDSDRALEAQSSSRFRLVLAV
jgi:hypothetical protein